MAWAASDWTKSGITDSFRWVMCDNRTLAELGDMTGFVDGRISASYEGDLKYSGSINVSSSNFTTGRLLRLYYTATLASEGKSTTICLGTFHTGNDNQRYIHGRYTGTIELYSMLKTQTDSKLLGSVTFTPGKSALNVWWQLHQGSGTKSIALVNGVKDANWKNEEIVDFGTQRLTALNKIADFLTAQVTVDANGHIVLVPYVAPASKPVNYSVPSGSSSLVFEGVDVTVNRTDCVNRYGIRYEKTVDKKKVTIYGQARLAADNSYSFEKRGRFVDETETIQNMTPETKDRANAIAESRLKRFARGGVQYTFDSYYMPYAIGDVIRFTYKDNEASGGIDVDGLVTNIEYTLGLTGMKMQTTIRRVRTR